MNESTLINAGIQAGLIEPDLVARLKKTALKEKISLMDAVTKGVRMPKAAFYQALAELRGIPFLQATQLKVDMDLMRRLPQSLVRKRVLPVKRSGKAYLVTANPEDRGAIETAKRTLGIDFTLALAAPEAIEAVISRLNKREFSPSGPAQSFSEADSVKYLDDIMKEVYLRRVTDVHFEPMDEFMRVRFRVDGVLQDYTRTFSLEEQEALISRIKVLAGLDIAEQRMPQDGVFRYRIEKWSVPETDIRVATLPTRWGERLTMRILGQETGNLSLEELGMHEDVLKGFRQAIVRPHGIILVTGPTGSGKSTTLYAALRELDVDQKNIMTVEDPVEQTIEGISQTQVSSKVDFVQALRSFLRHDPDIILVGEIRDGETAQVAIRAAMTGHLVLSTLHTNDSVGAVTRLSDIGVERYLVGSTLIGVMSQRLVRKLCPRCRKKYVPGLDDRRMLKVDKDADIRLYKPVGCSSCLGTGYRGRTGVYEILWIDSRLQRAISRGADEDEIRSIASGIMSLWEDARRKVLAGITSMDEVRHLYQGAE